MREFERDHAALYGGCHLPYYITTPLIMKFMEEAEKCLSLTVMVQEEVALRFCATENTPDYGAVTANIALRGVCGIIRRVSRNMFTPRPNVEQRCCGALT